MTIVSKPAVIVAFLAIAVDIGLARLGFGLVLPAIRHELGGRFALYGGIAAVHLGGYLVGTIAAPWVLRDRTRLPIVTAAAHLVVAAALAASAAASDPVMLGIARAVLGVASGVGIASAVTDALERVPSAGRGPASALMWTGMGIGLLVSAPAGAWALGHARAWRIVTLVAAIPALSIVASALRLPPQRVLETDPSRPRFGRRELFATGNIFFVASYAGFGVAYIAYATFAVAAFSARGIPPLLVSLLWAAFGLAAVIGALGIARILAGHRHRWSMAIPLALSAVGSLISTLPSTAGAVGGALCIGTGLAAVPAVASAFARDRSDAASYARAFAGFTIVFGIGQMFGPILAGAAADTFGLAAIPLFTAAVFGGATLCALIDAGFHGPAPQASANS